MSYKFNKTLTYGVMHLVVAMAVAYTVTGSLEAALAIGVLEPERAQSDIGFAVGGALGLRIPWAHAADHAGGHLAAAEKPYEVSRHDDRHLERPEALNLTAHAQQSALHAVADHKKAHAQKKRPRAFENLDHFGLLMMAIWRSATGALALSVWSAT